MSKASRNELPDPGVLLVLSAPSGAGKTTLVKALMESDPRLRFSVSYTTRPPRPGEVPDRDYHFVSPDEFRQMVAGQQLLEHAEVFGNFYGTGQAQVNELLAGGHHVLLEIDWQGARQIKARMPGCRTVFILPPSLTELERRLRTRGTDSEDVIRRRFGQALDDMSHWAEFDFVVVNDDLTTAVAGVRRILAGEARDLATDSPAAAGRALLVLGKQRPL